MVRTDIGRQRRSPEFEAGKDLEVGGCASRKDLLARELQSQNP
jgi:hypothetical protein